MISYYLFGLLLTTIFVFIECYVHEIVYDDGAYKTPLNILAFFWAILIAYLILERVGYEWLY